MQKIFDYGTHTTQSKTKLGDYSTQTLFFLAGRHWAKTLSECLSGVRCELVSVRAEVSVRVVEYVAIRCCRCSLTSVCLVVAASVVADANRPIAADECEACCGELERRRSKLCRYILEHCVAAGVYKRTLGDDGRHRDSPRRRGEPIFPDQWRCLVK